MDRDISEVDRRRLDHLEQKLREHDEYVVTRPLSGDQIAALEERAGRPMPPVLRWYFEQVGLFTDLTGWERGELLESADEYEEETEQVSRILGEPDHRYFPFARDGYGNVFAVDARDERSVYLVDHERSRAVAERSSLAECLEAVVEEHLAGDPAPNSEKG